MADQRWPPEDWEPVYKKMREWAAWYSGDSNQLAKVYSDMVATPTDQGKFWAEKVKEERKTMLHLPVAGDIAETSANLLFGEMPDFKIPEAHEENASSDAKATQDRLNEIVNESDFQSRLLEGAESASALTGIFLKVNWDTSFKDFPVLSVAQPDNAIPYFRWGFLTKVIFHKVVERAGYDEVYRHLEIHEPGLITNELWKGTESKLGNQIPLEKVTATADLEDQINTGIDDILVRYVPNKTPNRLWRGSNLGQSDLSGVEDFMDSLDEVYTSWMRDIQLGKGRVVVPEHWLEKDETTGDLEFDENRRYFVGMPMGPPEPGQSGSKEAIINQFDIRAQKHRDTALDLMEQIATKAGYSPQSFGLKGEGGQKTAEEVRAKESKSYKTKSKKGYHFQRKLEEIAHLMLQVDKKYFNSRVSVFKPQVDIKDGIKHTMADKADALEKINRATAASIETRIRYLHPEWTESQVKEERDKIMKEQGMSVSPPEMGE